MEISDSGDRVAKGHHNQTPVDNRPRTGTKHEKRKHPRVAYQPRPTLPTRRDEESLGRNGGQGCESFSSECLEIEPNEDSFADDMSDRSQNFRSRFASRGNGATTTTSLKETGRSIDLANVNSSSRSLGRKQIPSLRWKWNMLSSKGVSADENDVVANFFDVQSVATAPDRFGSRRFQFRKKKPKHSDEGSEHFETRSATSLRGYARGSVRIAPSDHSHADGDVDDDEITLGSEFFPEEYRRTISEYRSSPTTVLSNSVDLKGDSRLEKKKKFRLLRRIFGSKKRKKKHKEIQRARYQAPPSSLTMTDFPWNSGDFDTFLAEFQDQNRSAASCEGCSLNQERCPLELEISVESDPKLKVSPQVYGSVEVSEVAYDTNDSRSDILFDESDMDEKPDNGVHQEELDEYVEESKSEDYHESSEGDESSILSFLGGLLATWAGEVGNDECKSSADEKDDRESRGLRSCLKNAEGSKGCSGSGKSKKSNSVSFSVVQVREYERTLGDNPACPKGPPISLGWLYQVYPDVCITEHGQRTKRTKGEMRLPPSKRTSLLVDEWKVTAQEIRKAQRETTFIQYCREKSAYTGRPKEAVQGDKEKIDETPQHLASPVGPAKRRTKRRNSLDVYVPPLSPPELQPRPVMATSSSTKVLLAI